MKKTIFLITLIIWGIACTHAHNAPNVQKKKASLISRLSKAPRTSLRSSMPEDAQTFRPDSTIQFSYPDNIPNYKSSFKYDTNGNQILLITSIPSYENPEEWEYESKEVSEYDGEGNPVKTEEYEWDWYSEQWELYYSRTYSYNDGELCGYTTTIAGVDDPVETKILIDYDEDTGQVVAMSFLNVIDETLQESHRYDYDYDDEGYLVEQLYSEWDPEEKEFIPEEVDVYLYDDYGRIAGMENYWGLDEDEEWFKFIKLAVFYDANNKASSMDIYYSDEETNNWEVTPEEYIKFYYAGNTGIKPLASPTGIKIGTYGQAIRIQSETELASVGVYNMLGQLIINQTATGNTAILPVPAGNGVYFVKATNIQGKYETAKIVIY